MTTTETPQSLLTECDGCSALVPLAPAAFYWTTRGYELRPTYCAKCAMQHEAPIIKPQPKRTESNFVDGWDV